MKGEEGGGGAAVAGSGDDIAGGTLAAARVELECDAMAYGGFDMIGEVSVRGSKGGKCSDRSRVVRRMPMFTLLHALVLQRGNARLFFRYAQSDYDLGFVISSIESSAARFEPL